MVDIGFSKQNNGKLTAELYNIEEGDTIKVYRGASKPINTRVVKINKPKAREHSIC